MEGQKTTSASIQAYLTPARSSVKPPVAEIPIGDGFTVEELQNSLKPKALDGWHPGTSVRHCLLPLPLMISDFEYADMEISDLVPGPKAVTFMGRVANIFDVANSRRTPHSAKGCIKFCVKDGSGAITVRLWYAACVPNIRLGSLVSIWVNHISNGENGMLSSSSAPLFASLFPERDRNCHMMVHENSDDGKMYRTPLDYQDDVPINRLMTIQTFMNGGHDVFDAKILVVVKSIGAKKKGGMPKSFLLCAMADCSPVTRKDESVTENINLQVHDDTGEATLGLWGTSASSPVAGRTIDTSNPGAIVARDSWKSGETVLLIHAPGWKIGRSFYLSLTSATMIDVDPSIPDADWLRCWSLRLKTREAINPHFPSDVFDADLVRKGSIRCLFTIADLDEVARCSPFETFQGYLSLVITEFKLFEYWKRKMLLSGECCSIPMYANALTGICKGCESEVRLRLNPRIIGQVLDETAAISCGKLLFSDEAWKDLLGRGPEALLRLEYEEVKYLSDRILFTRVSVLFGWTGDETKAGGRICVVGIES